MLSHLKERGQETDSFLIAKKKGSFDFPLISNNYSTLKVRWVRLCSYDVDSHRKASYIVIVS